VELAHLTSTKHEGTTSWSVACDACGWREGGFTTKAKAVATGELHWQKIQAEKAARA
jgi:hypothetical protein